MRAIVVGHGSSVSAWLDKLESRPGIVVSAAVSGESALPAGGNMPATFSTLDAALEHVRADAVLLLDFPGPSIAARALSSGLSVVVPDPGSFSADEVRQLLTEAGRTSVYPLVPRSFQYRRCRRMLMRFLRSGWLGAIGHVSCIDRRHSTAPLGNATVSGMQLCRYGASQLGEICEVFESRPRSITSRLAAVSGAGASTEAFLSLQNGVEVHYFGIMSAEQVNADHTFWIEGTRGSLKTDGRKVWWRKRGWPVFLPVRVGLLRSQSDDPTGLGYVAKSASRRGSRPDPDGLRLMNLIAAARESDRLRRTVNFRDPERGASAE